jgi:hypothetical protein
MIHLAHVMTPKLLHYNTKMSPCMNKIIKISSLRLLATGAMMFSSAESVTIKNPQWGSTQTSTSCVIVSTFMYMTHLLRKLLSPIKQGDRPPSSRNLDMHPKSK